MSTATPTYPMPPDSPLMARCRLSRAERLRMGDAPEDEVHKSLFSVCKGYGYQVIHIPNGLWRKDRNSKRGHARAAKWRALGFHPGASDLFIIDLVTFLEVKRPSARERDVSDNQRMFIELARAGGAHADVCFGYDEGLAYLNAARAEAVRAARALDAIGADVLRLRQLLRGHEVSGGAELIGRLEMALHTLQGGLVRGAA